MRSRLNTIRSQARNESGVAMVEFAFVAILLFSIMFGIVEFGLAFRDRLTVANATQASARVVATMGADEQADFFSLQALAADLETLPSAGVQIINSVDIYLSDGNGDPVGNCGTGDRCNRYVYWPGFTATCDWNPCPDADAGYGGWPWPPPDRDVELPGLEVIGVEIHFSHDWLTGFLPLPTLDCAAADFSDCWHDTAIMRLEPQRFGS
ncbi:MAG: TadE/TadG family type IV pilus assembly protein [Actinomycetota bacterium]|nr:TadE/TadG family type IV pilus assembly protein [Actinomycetota bacterium]